MTKIKTPLVKIKVIKDSQISIETFFLLLIQTKYLLGPMLKKTYASSPVEMSSQVSHAGKSASTA